MRSSHTQAPCRSNWWLAVAAATLIVTGAHAQGALVAWGNDASGVVSGIPPGSFVAIASGGNHAVAVRADGTLASWGDDSFGQISATPAGTFFAVAARGACSVAIRTDGTLAAWGDDSFGQVSGVPAGAFSAVAAGGEGNVAIRTDGTLVAWGLLGFGEVPSGTFFAIAAAGSDGAGIRTDGTLVAWDVLGGMTIVPGPFTAVISWVGAAVALRADGTLAYLFLGGLNAPPVHQVPAGTFSDLAAGLTHALAVRTDGSLASWGDDTFGQVSGTPTGVFSAVAAGGGFSLAIADSGNQPPVITCNNPMILWSPDHALVDAGSVFSVSDPDDDPVTLTCRVFSDETEIPDTGDGTGRHAPDFKTTLQSGAQGVFVRSERRATENGRFYIIVITADDGNGGVTTAVCIAAVCPHDQTQESLDDVLAQAAIAAAQVQADIDNNTLPPSPDAPVGLREHGLSEQLGPIQ